MRRERHFPRLPLKISSGARTDLPVARGVPVTGQLSIPAQKHSSWKDVKALLICPPGAPDPLPRCRGISSARGFAK